MTAQEKLALARAFDFTIGDGGKTHGEEGGFSNRPLADDPGGPTKYGVSLRAHREDIGDRDHDGDVDADDVQLLTLEDARALFAKCYWTPARCGELPPALAMMVADFAYNSGVSRAVKELQRAMEMLPDGMMGPKTLAASNRADLAALIPEYGSRRVVYCSTLKNWEANRLGWTRRIMRLVSEATRLHWRVWP